MCVRERTVCVVIFWCFFFPFFICTSLSQSRTHARTPNAPPWNQPVNVPGAETVAHAQMCRGKQYENLQQQKSNLRRRENEDEKKTRKIFMCARAQFLSRKFLIDFMGCNVCVFAVCLNACVFVCSNFPNTEQKYTFCHYFNFFFIVFPLSHSFSFSRPLLVVVVSVRYSWAVREVNEPLALASTLSIRVGHPRYPQHPAVKWVADIVLSPTVLNFDFKDEVFGSEFNFRSFGAFLVLKLP